MTAASVTTDLANVTLMEAGTIVTNIGGGTAAAAETDFYIQGSQCFSRRISNATAGFGILGSFTITSDQHLYIWVNNQTPGGSLSRANGGVRIYAGSSGTAYRAYYVDGNESLIGGWKCYVVQPNAIADATVGAPGTSNNFLGAALSTNVTINRSNLGIDPIRYGNRVTVSGGTSPDPPASFSAVSSVNDSTTNRWGVFNGTDSGASLAGRLYIGLDDNSTATTFTQGSAVLVKPNLNPIDVNPKTTASLSGVYLQGSQTTASFSEVTFLSLDETDRGRFDASSATNKVSSATVNKCIFQDWGIINGWSSVSFDECQFKNTGLVTTNGGSISNSFFTQGARVSVGTSLSALSYNSFEYGNNLIENAITTSVNSGTVSFIGNTFSGYGDNNTDTAAIYFTAVSGSVTVNVSDGGTIPTYKTNGVTVTINSASTLTLTGLVNNTEVRVYEAGTTTEVAGQENVTTGSFATSISVGAVDIQIFAVSYIAIRLTNVVTTSDVSIPVVQQIDRQYANP